MSILLALLEALNKYSNVVLVAVTGVYAWFTILLWRATRRQAEAAREQAALARGQAELTRAIFEATHRPEVAVEPVLKQAAHPGLVRLSFRATNHGRQTAIITSWSAVLMHSDKAVGVADSLTANIAVFSGASSEALPYVEMKGSGAAALWKSSGSATPHAIRLDLEYRGAGPTTYKTEVRGTLWMLEPWVFSFEHVEHAITQR